MDNLSLNATFSYKNDGYPNNNGFANLKNVRSSQQEVEIQYEDQMLFQKRNGTAWVLIIRKPSGKIKAYLKEIGVGMRPLTLKGIPEKVELKKIEKARTVLGFSNLLLTDYQIEILPGLKGGVFSKEDEPKELAAPAEYYCTVNRELMKDPYINELGNTYEKSVLEALLKTTRKDPITNQFFQKIFPNRTLKAAIQIWKKQNLAIIKPGHPYMQAKNAVKAQHFLKLAREVEDTHAFFKAEENYKKALRYTDDPRDYKQYAQFLSKLKSKKRACKAYLELGKLYEENDHLVEAKASYEAARVFFPEKEKILKAIGEVNSKLKNNDDILSSLNLLASSYAKGSRLHQAIEKHTETFEILEEGSAYEPMQKKQKFSEIKVWPYDLAPMGNLNHLSLHGADNQELKCNVKIANSTEIEHRFWQKFNNQKSLINRAAGSLGDQANFTLISKAQIEILKSSPLCALDFRDKSELTDNEFNDVFLTTFSHISTLSLKGCTRISNLSIHLLAQKSTNLMTLNLSGCSNITDESLEFIQGLPALTALDLSFCSNITDKSLESVKSFSVLKALNFSSEYITDKSLEYIQDLPGLTALDFSFCSNVTDQGMKAIKSLSSLTALDFSFCSNITDQGMKAIKSLSVLTSLGFSGCNDITDKGLKLIRVLTLLKNLSFCNCNNITDQGLEVIKGLHSLTNLSLSECNNITEKGLTSIKNASSKINISR